MGRLLGGEITSSINPDFKKRVGFDYLDDVGNRQYKNIYDFENGSWEKDFNDEYEYYEGTNRLFKISNRDEFGTLNFAKGYQYNANGNMVNKVKTDGSYYDWTYYEYDDYNNLETITLPDGKTEDYRYNMAGQRIAKTDKMDNKYHYIYSGTEVSFEARSNLIRGDINADGTGPDIGDVIALVNFMFQGGQSLPVPE